MAEGNENDKLSFMNFSSSTAVKVGHQEEKKWQMGRGGVEGELGQLPEGIETPCPEDHSRGF